MWQTSMPCTPVCEAGPTITNNTGNRVMFPFRYQSIKFTLPLYWPVSWAPCTLKIFSLRVRVGLGTPTISVPVPSMDVSGQACWPHRFCKITTSPLELMLSIETQTGAVWWADTWRMGPKAAAASWKQPLGHGPHATAKVLSNCSRLNSWPRSSGEMPDDQDQPDRPCLFYQEPWTSRTKLGSASERVGLRL